MSSEPELLPEEWLIELGKIVKAWITFEQLFNLMLQKLAGHDDLSDPTFTILVTHTSFPQRLDMLKALCEQKVDQYPHLKDYKNVASKVAEAQRIRNFFMHNMIGIDSDGIAKVAQISARGRLRTELREIQLDELKAASAQILEAGKATYRLVLNSDPWQTT